MKYKYLIKLERLDKANRDWFGYSFYTHLVTVFSSFHLEIIRPFDYLLKIHDCRRNTLEHDTMYWCKAPLFWAKAIHAGSSTCAIQAGSGTSGIQTGSCTSTIHPGPSTCEIHPGSSTCEIHSGSSTCEIHAGSGTGAILFSSILVRFMLGCCKSRLS